MAREPRGAEAYSVVRRNAGGAAVTQQMKSFTVLHPPSVG